MPNDSPESHSIAHEPDDNFFRVPVGANFILFGAAVVVAVVANRIDIHNDMLVINHISKTGPEMANGALLTWMGYNLTRGRELFGGLRNDQQAEPGH